MSGRLALLLLLAAACSPPKPPPPPVEEADAGSPDLHVNCKNRLGQGEGQPLATGPVTFSHAYWVEHVCDGVSLEPTGYDVTITDADGAVVPSTVTWRSELSEFMPFRRVATFTFVVPKTRFVRVTVVVHPDVGTRVDDYPVFDLPVRELQWTKQPADCAYEVPISATERVCVGNPNLLRPNRLITPAGTTEFSGPFAWSSTTIGLFGPSTQLIDRRTWAETTVQLPNVMRVRSAVAIGDAFVVLADRMTDRALITIDADAGVSATVPSTEPEVIGGDDAGLLLAGPDTVEFRPANALDRTGRVRVTTAGSSVSAAPGLVWSKANDTFSMFDTAGRVAVVPYPSIPVIAASASRFSPAAMAELYSDTNGKLGWVAEPLSDGGIRTTLIRLEANMGEPRVWALVGDTLFAWKCDQVPPSTLCIDGYYAAKLR